jgi:hypothetical protein
LRPSTQCPWRKMVTLSAETMARGLRTPRDKEKASGTVEKQNGGKNKIYSKLYKK